MKRRTLLEYGFSAVLVAVIFGLIALQLFGPWGNGQASVPKPWPITSPGPVAIGVTTTSLARNSFRTWRPSDLVEVNRFEQNARLHANTVMWFTDWARGAFNAGQARAVAQRGSIPEISWEPWDSRVGEGRPQPKYTLKSIIDGRHDPYIHRFAEAVSRYRGPVRLRFAQEMNGNWYPWSETVNGNRPGEFVRAWRHVHKIFELAGATNVQWVWSPVSGAPRADFPGSGEVDVLGSTCLNGGTHTFGRGWRSFAAICGNSIAQLHALDPRLPIELSETASTQIGGSKPSWIAGMFAYLARHPAVKSMNWFNVRKETDWQIESSRAAEQAFADGAANLRASVSG